MVLEKKLESNVFYRNIENKYKMTKIKFNQALTIATKSAMNSNMKFKLGAVLYDRTKYTTGYNRGFNVEVPHRDRPFSIHAEEMCILKGMRVGIDFEAATLIVVRIGKAGDLRVSKPCVVCQRLIEKVRIRQIYYIG